MVMGKFIESTLRCVTYFFLSWLAGKFIYSIINIALETATSEGTVRILLNLSVKTLVICLFLYIIMHRSGYNGNITMFSGKKPVKEIFIPIIIAVLLFQTLQINTDIDFRGSFPPGYYLFISENRREIFVSLLPQFIIQTILYAASMILGYNKGYIKSEKEKIKMTSDKMIV